MSTTTVDISKELKDHLYFIYSQDANLPASKELHDESLNFIKATNKSNPTAVKGALQETIEFLAGKYNVHTREAELEAVAQARLSKNTRTKTLTVLAKTTQETNEKPTHAESAEGCKKSIIKLADLAVSLGHSELRKPALNLVGGVHIN